MGRFYRLFGAPRIVPWIVFCLLATGFSLFAPRAANADEGAFTVQDVAVDVTADSAAAAREQAFAQAQQAAFAQLAQRLLPESEAASFQPPESSAISPLIKDFEITREQLSNVQYLATYTFRFDENAVRGFFGGKNLSYTAVTSKPVLVLPFYQTGSRTLLWGEANLWLKAWNSVKPATGLVPLTVPIGDAQDVSDIGDSEALTYDPQNLAAMIARYGAGDALVMIASAKWPAGQDAAAPDTGGPEMLDIALYKAGKGAPQFFESFSVAQADIGANAGLFEAAVSKSAQAIQKEWKNQTAAPPSQATGFKARATFASMQEWMQIQQKLRGVSGIADFKLVSLTPHEAALEFQFQGDESRLRLALQQEDLGLAAPQPAATQESGWGGGWGYGSAAAPATYDIYSIIPAALPSAAAGAGMEAAPQ